MLTPSWKQKIDEYGHQFDKIVRAEWHLGVTAFGGPPVHFKIFHDRFVNRLRWIDEQLYQELFSISQALSGPGSTKMLYCINLIQTNFLGALLGFLLWSLPGAFGMFGLGLGVSTIGSTLPRAVYALLSGLNAATVGIIVLAAVELSNKAITDKMTRTLVFLSGAAGLLYNALWYFPVLIIACGVATVVHDKRWLHGPVKAIIALSRRTSQVPPRVEEGEHTGSGIELNSSGRTRSTEVSPSPLRDTNQDAARVRQGQSDSPTTDSHPGGDSGSGTEPRIIPQQYQLNFAWKSGIAIITAFFASFIAVLVIRGVLPDAPLLYRLFSNLYLAGTIIFGGGPVVIPLLREYIVAEGWVSPRDFLIGLAIAQAFPGPNFNFAVFLGTLTAANNGKPPIAGAVLSFIGIYFPGLVLVHGTMGLWASLRSRPWVKSGVRGVNAGAVGLIYTAVYRIWLVGYLDEGFQSGRSLGDDPWWVVVTATAFVGCRYYGFSAPVAIVIGAILGLIRYGVVVGAGQ
ncbi:chromate transporter-domain-containing protein [Poronia punctata]|nr:chromate transporter-domain-containing protein [Poronia punctata]